MPGKVRMRAAGVPRFRHADLVFGPGWNDYALAELDDKQRAAIRTYLGRFITVHPGDRRLLATWLNAEAKTETDAEGETGASAVADTEAETELESMTVRDLRAMADDLGIDIPTSARKKSEIIQLLEAESG